MKAVVTGANGFVGKAVVKELVSQGISVYAVVRQGAKHIDDLLSVSGITLVYCNMEEYEQLPEKMSGEQIDIFYHFAWTGSAGPLRGDEKIQLGNVYFSCNAVRAAAKLNCKKFVFSSSIMEYEIAALMKTEMIPALSAVYCTSKITANYLCRILSNSLKLEYVTGIISNIYGPGESSPRLINTSIRKLLRGEHVSFSPGEQLYDFIYITDAAKIFIAIGKKGINNKSYYIGSRNPRPLKSFLLEMAQTVSPGVEIGLGEVPFEGISLTYTEFDIDAVYNDTGIEAVVPFCHGISQTAKWIMEEGEM